MADETQTVRNFNWREFLPFTQIFRAFRVSVHPSKLILALGAILSIYIGGRALDQVFPARSRAVVEHKIDVLGMDGRLARPDQGLLQANVHPRFVVTVENEIDLFEDCMRQGPQPVSFADTIKLRRERLVEAYANRLTDAKVVENLDKGREEARNGSGLRKYKAKLEEERNEALAVAQARRNELLAAAKTAVERSEIDARYKNTAAFLVAVAHNRYKEASAITGQGVFIQLLGYEIRQIDNVVAAVMANDWLGGTAGNPDRRARPGVIASLKNLVMVGPWWMFTQHTTYCILFLIVFSMIWAIFGGAISRIAAVHVARDEKISLGGALRFSKAKFLSFIFAPIIPLLIVLVVGLLVALGGLVGNIRWIGPILMGLFFIIAIAAGFVMTLVMIGTIGGFNLMYPTIAVEGSDSFDAISRSFSYVYARPWRMIFLTIVAIIYGALCYFFVKFFVGAVLALTQHFVGWGMFVNVDKAIPIDLWGMMWPSGQVTYDLDTITLYGDQAAGGFLISFWVHLTMALVGAFAISFFFSANTIIYYLMRREVDATELDDVYLEQSDEEFGETQPAAAAPAAPEAAPVPDKLPPSAPETPATDQPQSPPANS